MYTTPERIKVLLRDFVRVECYSDEEIEQFIKKAQARIDDRLRPHYKVPFTEPIPDMIISICEDFSCSFLVDQDYVDRPNSEQVPLAQVYFRRAERDLERIVSSFSLDGLPGVQRITSPADVAGMLAATNTPNESPMQMVLKLWP